MNKKKVSIACQKCRTKNYYLFKSIKNRLVLNKYCKVCNEKSEHKEEK